MRRKLALAGALAIAVVLGSGCAAGYYDDYPYYGQEVTVYRYGPGYYPYGYYSYGYYPRPYYRHYGYYDGYRGYHHGYRAGRPYVAPHPRPYVAPPPVHRHAPM
jgi:hypothetical protein